MASDGSWLSALVDWAVSLMDVVGPAGAGIAVALENVFPPVPSEVILPVAGLSASRGAFTLVEAIAWTTAGSIVGALLLYGLGAWLGLDRLRSVAGRIPLLQVQDIDRTVAWFHRHGGKAVLFGRMLPIFRSFISVPAGVTRMPLARFVLLTGIGSLAWNTIFVLAGFVLGESWHVIERYTDILQWVVLAAIAGAVLWFVGTRLRALRGARRRPETAAD
jgi:membrane protein DedA with SNARE-associated domain